MQVCRSHGGHVTEIHKGTSLLCGSYGRVGVFALGQETSFSPENRGFQLALCVTPAMDSGLERGG